MNEKLKKSALAGWESASPEKLIGRTVCNAGLNEFVLALAVIFNDLKSLQFGWSLIVRHGELPRSPTPETMDERVAELVGISQHIVRWECALLNELMECIQANKAIVQGKAFAGLLLDMPESPRLAWAAVEQVALTSGAEKQDKKSAAYVLYRIRNQVGFHYSAHTLAKGYRKWFFDMPPNPANKRAVFSDGKTMEASRFNFGDAAARGAVEVETAGTGLSYEQVVVVIRGISEAVNHALKSIVITHLREVDPHATKFKFFTPRKRRSAKKARG